MNGEAGGGSRGPSRPPRNPRVLLAPDKFKGCLTAAEVAAAVAAGLHRHRPDLDIVAVPVADGGDGTVAAALSAGYSRVEVLTVGPTGLPVRTSYGLTGHRAVIELADVVGLARLPGGRLDPLVASTAGLGTVVGDALDRGATEIVLGLGGSASTDGGAGLIQALGGALLDAGGQQLPPGGGALASLHALDLDALRARTDGVRFVVACDVDNPLLGVHGAAAVFGPQKGASPAQVQQLDAALAVWARVVADAVGVDLADRPGAGAAGGTGFAALAVLGAELRPGIELVLELVGFDRLVTGADLVVTGEGSLDGQSLAGKAPIGVAQAAARAGVPVVAVAGRNLLSDEQLHRAGISAVYALNELEPDLTRSMAQASGLLSHLGGTIADRWLLGSDT
ncbi:MAG TPA: glycerate kinase [Propionibacteriaceae bacterium]|nr:glycerate kinase [Propionibacteriaceae bacterium]